jgi:hypothetical protein
MAVEDICGPLVREGADHHEILTHIDKSCKSYCPKTRRHHSGGPAVGIEYASEARPAFDAAERWPGLALASAFAERDVGQVRVCLANKTRTKPQTDSGSRMPAHEIRPNTHVIARPKAGEAVLFVDDNVTKPKRLAAQEMSLHCFVPCRVFPGIVMVSASTPPSGPVSNEYVACTSRQWKTLVDVG